MPTPAPRNAMRRYPSRRPVLYPALNDPAVVLAAAYVVTFFVHVTALTGHTTRRVSNQIM